uniref:C3H1-type domain-containing protein n=1 Tax=Aegilops tauschii subsp. strangulata TaxID=200361 RepID=A0A453NFJ2_AEGTS
PSALDPGSRPPKPPSSPWEGRPVAAATEASKWMATRTASASTSRTASTRPALVPNPRPGPSKPPSPPLEGRPMALSAEASKWTATRAASASTLDAVGAGSGSDEEIPECIMFSVGFCLNGPNCKCMHVKLPGPPPVQEVLQKFQQTNAYNYGSSSTTYQPRDNNCKQKAKPQVQHESVLENQNLAVNATLVAQQPAAQHVQTENPPPHLQQQQNAQVQGVHNGSSIQKLPQLQAHFHKGNQGTWLLNFATRRIWILVQWGVFAPQKGLMRLNLTKHVHGECHFNILHL